MSAPASGAAPVLFDPAEPEKALFAAGNLAALFHARAEQLGARPFLHRSARNGWTGWSWQETAERVRGIAQRLARWGITPGQRVLLVSPNRPEWHASALGVLSLGAVTVPLVANAPDDWSYIIGDAQPAAAIVSHDLVPKFRAAAANAGWNARCLIIDAPDDRDGSSWAAAAAETGSVPTVPATIDDLCCLMYTSGTGGRPKGVEQTHRNILASAAGAIRNLAPYGLTGHRFFSFLPLSHTFEHTAGFATPIALGAEVFVSKGPEHFGRELPAASPTVMFVVPRFCEVMQQRIEKELQRQGALARWLFHRTVERGRKNVRGETLSAADRVWQATAGRAVQRKLGTKFGGALRCMLCAGAPLRPETSEFFNGLGLRLHQAYGMTETSPGITMQQAGRLRPGTVGPPMHGVEVRLATDGEILVRGANVMRGYWRDRDATAAAIVDGWLHTGDIGRFDADGELIIVDRKKDFLKTAGAEMVAPQPIELALTNHPGVAQAMLCGDGWPHLAALLVPDAASREALATGATDGSALHAQFQAAVDRVNAGLGSARRIRRFAILTEPLSVENGLLTSTLKIRRRAVLERHAAIVAGLREAAG